MHGFKSMSVNDMCASVDARRTVSVIVCRMRSFNKSTCATVRSACATIDIYIHTLPDACAAVCELMLTPPLTPALFSWTPPPPRRPSLQPAHQQHAGLCLCYRTGPPAL